jgi:hypothetical protein
MSLLWWNPIDWYRGTCFDVLCLSMDAYCVDCVSFRWVVFEVEVELTKIALKLKLARGRLHILII